LRPDEFQRVKRALLRALELSGDERRAYLDETLSDDAALRREAESLLAHHEATSSDNLTESVHQQIDALEHPDRIGPYRILEVIGEGGMGVVYLADQEQPVHRRVAVKVIKLGMDTKEVVARFESERQALAMMSHPNIARVFDGGSTESGRPYFVMEHVPGLAITDSCDRERRSVKDRLRLFIQVCQAIQHAHQKGVIHRDIKPSNILVTMLDNKPVPKVIDFGVAKATGPAQQAVFTQQGMLLGTPAYMSPEQADPTAASVDTTTDIYSLGVVLYELLVGALPFGSEALGSTDFDELRRRIREEEPARPSTRLGGVTQDVVIAAQRRMTDPLSLRRQVRGDLDWIVMKALDKSPARRYGSATELSNDIERHLRSEPVTAGPPSTAYRMKKFVIRHRTGVCAASLVALALVAGAIGTTTGMVRARRAETMAKQDAALARQTTRFLVDLFAVSDPLESSGETITARELLDRGAERISHDLADQPLTQAELMNTIGDIYRKLGLYDPAISLLERALASRRELLGTRDSALAASVTSLATLYWTVGRYTEAEPLYREALEIQEARLGPDHLDVSKCLNNLAYHYQSLGDYARAEPLYLRSQSIREAALGHEHPRVALGLHNLGMLYADMGRSDVARDYYERTLAILDKVREPGHPDYAPTLHNLANIYAESGRPEEAERLHVRAESIWVRTLGPAHINVALSRKARGDALVKMRRYAEAESLYDQSLGIAERALGPEHRNVAHTLEGLGSLRRLQGRPTEGEAYYRRAVAILEKSLGPDNPALASPLEALASIRADAGDDRSARPLLERALQIRTKARGADDPGLLPGLEALARVLRRLGEDREAEALDSRAATLRRASEEVAAAPPRQ
jgi:non-specific serine/threonine protein kinase/serine/threonine-protein kinase